MARDNPDIALLTRGAVDIIERAEFEKRLAAGRPLRVKVGFDPTSADLHLGHTVLFTKMRQFQDCGHTVIFLIGDFTALIGDPSGQNVTRPVLSSAEIEANTRTFSEQAFKILDQDKTELRANSEWMGSMSAAGMVELAQSYTVARMLERRDFNERLQGNQPISIHEFLYPLVQGYDSVKLECDVELGGTDQLFNLGMGRLLQERHGQPAQSILTLPLLLGVKGEQKMSKSIGNHIGITEPAEQIFAKLMSLTDERMWHYYELLSLIAPDELARRKREATAGKALREAKEALAFELTARFHDEDAAARARTLFAQTFREHKIPDDIPRKTVSAPGGEIPLSVALRDSGLVASSSACRRLYAQGGIKVDQRVVSEEKMCKRGEIYLIQIGKRRFAELCVE